MKMQNEPHTMAAEIMHYYGSEHQLVKLCEECGELVQQAAKCIEKGVPYSEDFVEELADVRVMLMEFESLLPGVWADRYRGTIWAKLRRQIERIEGETAE